MKWILIVSFMLSMNSYAGGYFSIPADSPQAGPVTQVAADKIAADLFAMYFAESWQKTAKPLAILVDWQSPYFGGGVQQEGPAIHIKIFGGMVRTPEMNEDILAAVICHELGHILGGAPYQDIIGSEWTSVEGQADFFAASVCLPRYFKQLQPKTAVEDLQQKIMRAGLGLFQISQKYATPNQEAVSLERSAPEVATELNRHSYPSDQCRLDTFKAGARCLSDSTCRAPVCWLPR